MASVTSSKGKPWGANSNSADNDIPFGTLQITGEGTTSETLFVVRVGLKNDASFSPEFFFDYVADYPNSSLGEPHRCVNFAIRGKEDNGCLDNPWPHSAIRNFKGTTVQVLMGDSLRVVAQKQLAPQTISSPSRDLLNLEVQIKMLNGQPQIEIVEH